MFTHTTLSIVVNELSPYNRALGWLARREHSAQEILDKLLHIEGVDEAEADAVLARLQSLNLQSDERYAESYANGQANRGYGRIKIRYALAQKGVSEELINQVLSNMMIDWCALATRVWQKKYHATPVDYKEKMRQQAFLSRRGFDFDEIRAVFEK